MSKPALLLRVAVLPFETLDAFGAPRSTREIGALLERRDALDRSATALADQLYRIAGVRAEGDMPPEMWRARNAVLALRRDVHNRRSLRTQTFDGARSLLPEVTTAELERFHEALRQWNEDRGIWESGFREETVNERSALIERVRRPEFVESVWLASRSLENALEKLPRRDVNAWRNEETHAALKMLAYLVRSATKTSPNALFAATAPATLGAVIRIDGSAVPARVRTRMNISEARKVTACLAVDSALRSIIRPRPNPTLRNTAVGWSWWRPASLRRTEDDEVLLEAGPSPLLEQVVAMVTSGHRTWPELVELLARETGASFAEGERFLETLVERGFLIGEVEIPFLEARPLRALADVVRAQMLEPAWLPVLEDIERSLDGLAPVGSSDRRPALIRVAENLQSLPHARPIHQDELFRVDAVSGFSVEIPHVFRDELARTADAYVRVFAALYPFTRRDLYADLFLEQFPPDTDVPALDLYQRFSEPEFDTALGALPRPAGSGTQLGALEQYLLAGDSAEVRLSVEQLLDLVPAGDPGRWMAGALFQIAMPPKANASHPDLRIVLNALFHGCGLALARFHDLHPGDAIARTLERGWLSLLPEGAIAAEINYLPWGRTANASLRPRLFEHEIELPGDCASEGATVLPLADLLVRYGSADRRFHITSRALGGREVMPFLSSGVRPQGFASFLVHAGLQDLVPVAFFPGLDNPEVVHWPRLTLGRVVLFRERWVFAKDRCPAPTAAGAAWFENVQGWRRLHGLPRRVFAGSSRYGKPFFVDLDSPLMLELFRRFLVSLEDSDRCILSEMLPGPQELWLEDVGGRYASEFLVQLEGPL